MLPSTASSMEGSGCAPSTFSASGVCLTNVAINVNVAWYVTHVSEAHTLYRTNEVSKSTITIRYFKASMMTKGRFQQQLSRNKAFNSAPTGVEISKAVPKTANHCRGVSNTMSSAKAHTGPPKRPSVTHV